MLALSTWGHLNGRSIDIVLGELDEHFDNLTQAERHDEIEKSIEALVKAVNKRAEETSYYHRSSIELVIIQYLANKLIAIEHPACIEYFDSLSRSAMRFNLVKDERHRNMTAPISILTDHCITESHANKIISFAIAKGSILSLPDNEVIIKKPAYDFSRPYVWRSASGCYSIYGLVRIYYILNRAASLKDMDYLRDLLDASPLDRPSAWKTQLPAVFYPMLTPILVSDWGFFERLDRDSRFRAIKCIQSLGLDFTQFSLKSHPVLKRGMIKCALSYSSEVFKSAQPMKKLLSALNITMEAFEVELCTPDEGIDRVAISPRTFLSSMLPRFSSPKALLDNLMPKERQSLPVRDFKTLAVDAGESLAWVKEHLGGRHQCDLRDLFIHDVNNSEILTTHQGKNDLSLEDYLALGFNFTRIVSGNPPTYYHNPFAFLRATTCVQYQDDDRHRRAHNAEVTWKKDSLNRFREVLFVFASLALKDDYFKAEADEALGLSCYEDAFAYWMMVAGFNFGGASYRESDHAHLTYLTQHSPQAFARTKLHSYQKILSPWDDQNLVATTKLGTEVMALLTERNLSWNRNGFKSLLLEVLKKRPSLRAAAMRGRVLSLDNHRPYETPLLENLLMSHGSNTYLLETKTYKEYEALCGLNRPLMFTENTLNTLYQDLMQAPTLRQPFLALIIIAHCVQLSDDETIQIMNAHLRHAFVDDLITGDKIGRVFQMLGREKIDYLRTRLNELILQRDDWKVFIRTELTKGGDSSALVMLFLEMGFSSHKIKETNHIQALKAYLSTPPAKESVLKKFSVFVRVHRDAVVARELTDSERQRLKAVGRTDL